MNPFVHWRREKGRGNFGGESREASGRTRNKKSDHPAAATVGNPE